MFPYRQILILILLALAHPAGAQTPDTCSAALTLYTGAACLAAANTGAGFEGPPDDCVAASTAGIWFQWTADFTGFARLTTHARFNDVVRIFSGDCANLQPVACVNDDEHGFDGETAYFPVQAGTPFLFRISGVEDAYGRTRGELCVEIDPAPVLPQHPANDDCGAALLLTPDVPCTTATNLQADMSASQPGLNPLARADVWYRFSLPDPIPGQALLFRSNTDFSDNITLHAGDCDSLTERAGNWQGGALLLPGTLQAGADYYLQVTGNFASVEGRLCPELLHIPWSPPVNDECGQALEVAVGTGCVAARIAGATASAYTPACVPEIAADIWFRFAAPAGGVVELQAGAGFEHLLSLWKGSCAGLTPVRCIENPLPCAGNLRIDKLEPDSIYYVQFAVRDAAFLQQGADSLCLSIADGSTVPPVQPLELTVDQTCVSPFTAVLQVGVSGGQPPYTFLGMQTGSELPVGDGYFVAIRDALGCVQSASGTIDSCDASACYFSLAPVATHPSCSNASDGAITLQTVYGTAPYTFHWSDGSAEASRFGLAAGAYSVTVTDLAGCSDTVKLTLLAPPELAVILHSVEMPAAGLSNGSILADVSGGTPPYTYQWWRNDTLFSGGTPGLDGIPEGHYRLQVSDAHGCMQQFDTTLTGVVRLDEISQEENVRVFPNPARDATMAYLSFHEPVAIRLGLVDPSGRVLREWSAGTVQQDRIPVSLRGLPAGSYALHIQTPEGTIIRQIQIPDHP